jgi:hypothetical protein
MKGISNDPAARARSLANLVPGARKIRTARNMDKYAGNTLRQKLDQGWMDILEFCTSVLGIRLRDGQRAILKCLYGLQGVRRGLKDEEVDIYRKITTNDPEFERGIEKREAVLALGRGSGKSFLVSCIALYETLVKAAHWRQYVTKDELAYCCVVATRMAQCVDIIQKNCARLLHHAAEKHPWLGDLIQEELKDRLVFSNGMAIISLPCTSTAGRGLPVFMTIFDEYAHFRIEGTRADEAVYNGLTPRLGQFGGGKLFMISTPAAKQGVFWESFSQGFQVPGRLTCQGGTLLMNPEFDVAYLAKEEKRDLDSYRREFLAEFSESCFAFLPATELGECFRVAGDQMVESYRYFAGVDQSGLAGRDQFGFAIAHRSHQGEVVVDCVRSWATKSGDQIMGEIGELCQRYHVREILIDRYGAGWVKERFEGLGLVVGVRPELPTVFINLKSLILGKKVVLQDHKGLKDGLVTTEGYYSKSNSLSISHPRTSEGHGDLADAVATAVFAASARHENQVGLYIGHAPDVGDPDDDDLDGVWTCLTGRRDDDDFEPYTPD